MSPVARPPRSEPVLGGFGGYANPFSGYKPPKPPAPKRIGAAPGVKTTVSLGEPAGTPGTVRISCPSISRILCAYLLEDAPVIAGGYGGITRVARPRRVSATDYQGIDPFTMTIGVRLDGWDTGESVEPLVDFVNQISRDTSSRSGPPLIRLLGPVPFPNLQWLVDDVAWGPALWDQPAGSRLRQDVTFTLVQFVEVDTVAFTPAKRAAAKKATSKLSSQKPKVKKVTKQPTTSLTGAKS